MFFNVSEIPHRLVGRGRVVFSVDLAEAGQACPHAQSVLEFRHELLVFLDVLHPLRPRADDGHIALQDVEELRNLIDADLADHIADLRHARVAAAPVGIDLARLVGADVHAAELDDPEHASVFRAAVLVKENGAAVFDFYGDCRNQENRRKYREEQCRKYNVRQPFDETFDGIIVEVLVFKNRHVDKVAAAETFHQDIGNMRNDIELLLHFRATLDDHQARALFHIENDDGLMQHDLLLYFLSRLPAFVKGVDAEEVRVLFLELVLKDVGPASLVENDGRARLDVADEMLLGEDDDACRNEHLDAEAQEAPVRRNPVTRHETAFDPGDEIGQADREDLRNHELRNRIRRDLEGMVHARNAVVEEEVDEDRDERTADPVRIEGIVVIIQHPHRRKCGRDEHIDYFLVYRKNRVPFAHSHYFTLNGAKSHQ